MTEQQLARANEIRQRLGGIARARMAWESGEAETCFCRLLGLDRDEDYAINPGKVMTLPAVMQFRRSVFDRLGAEEEALRLEFAQL